MSWRVVVRGDSPKGDSIVALCNLTGLTMSEVQLALLKDGVIVGDGLSEPRARELADSIQKDSTLDCLIEHSVIAGDSPATFRVVLTGYRPGSRARLRRTVQKMSGLPFEQVIVWFSRIPFVLRENARHSTAMAIRRALTEAGGLVDLQPESSATIVLPGKTEPAAVDSPPEVEAQAAEDPELVPIVAVEAVTGSGADDFDFPVPSNGFTELLIPPVIALPDEWTPEQDGIHRPPVFRFTEPGKTPAVPSIFDAADDVEEGEPFVVEFTEPSSPILKAPALPHNTMKLFLCDPAEEDRDNVAEVLARVCDFPMNTSTGLVNNCPAWIASFYDTRRVSRFTTELAKMGVTVVMARNMPEFTHTGEASVSLLEWLSG
jgi:hypothetical protein